jgi:colanic acid/amylovoran biosynthesis glycosyltransferase
MAVCEDGKRKLINLGCKEYKIVVHHMGVDIERFRLKERYFNGSPVKVLTVGRLVEKKGLIYAIKAVSLLINKGHKIMYIIAGNGPLKSELNNLIMQLGMIGKIKLIDSVEQSEVKAIMTDFDIFLLPSVTGSDGDQEGIPVVLMEAMSTGMPVISTYHSGIPEIVEDGKSGFLVPERDVNALAGRLEYLIKHPELWSEMGRVGHEFVEKHYDIKKLNKQLVQIYEGVLSETS